MPMDNKGILAAVDIPPVGSIGRYHDIGFLFSGGFWLSGYNGDTLWANGQATISPFRDYIPGNVDSNQYDPRYKVYTINGYYPWPFSSEWQEWKTAVNFGADFYDGDGDGIYNPVDLNNNNLWDPEEDSPDIIGQQDAWCVFNDGDTTRYFDWISPLGIEIHQTLFGYRSYLAPQLQNVLFIRYKIFNTGKVNSLLDSVYFSAWTDPDLGDHADDLVGCDTLINSGYVYNSGPDWMFGHEPPAFFINLLQGPQAYIPGETFIDNNGNGTYEDSIDTPLDTAYNHQGPLMGYQLFPGAKNQKMSSFTHYLRNSTLYGGPYDEFETRNYMLGKHRDGNILDPCTWIFGEVRGGVDCNLVNPLYWYSGDPESNYGWINIQEWGQRMLVHTGPFSLEVNKPITIIVGYTIGQGDSPLNSVTEGKIASAFVQQFYQSNFDDNILPVEEENNIIIDEFKLYQNYPNPFNPSTKIKYQIPENSFVTLKLYDVLGNEIATLVSEEKPAGEYEVEFSAIGGSASVGNASLLPSGVYFYQLRSGNFVETKKMILMK